jgi:hypothetical protein
MHVHTHLTYDFTWKDNAEHGNLENPFSKFNNTLQWEYTRQLSYGPHDIPQSNQIFPDEHFIFL